ncbi:hypothetical protein AB1Y20_001940 [Prymnesium parvum]|uniref:Fe2OG dioxygenase domain-containing protein n=1 Tax=Prymnesium parvum TaxID=97485 RepID=A0AB34J7F9_PRYPA
MTRLDEVGRGGVRQGWRGCRRAAAPPPPPHTSAPAAPCAPIPASELPLPPEKLPLPPVQRRLSPAEPTPPPAEPTLPPAEPTLPVELPPAELLPASELLLAARRRVIDSLASTWSDGSAARAALLSCAPRCEAQARATAAAVVAARGEYSAEMQRQLVATGVCTLAELRGPAAELSVRCFERGFANLLLQAMQAHGAFWGGADAVPAPRCGAARAARLVPLRAVRQLMAEGLVVIDGALSAAELHAAREEVRRMHERAELRPVGFQHAVRNDHVGWVEEGGREAEGVPALSAAVRLLRAVPAEVQKHTGWELSVPRKVMVAVYAGRDGEPSFYKRHFDCRDPRTNPRRLTAILYLNEGWDAERDGGCLRAFTPATHAHADGRTYEDIAPIGGRLCVFRSCTIEHEVRPCFATRMALTLWVSGGDAPDEAATRGSTTRDG